MPNESNEHDRAKLAELIQEKEILSDPRVVEAIEALIKVVENYNNAMKKLEYGLNTAHTNGGGLGGKPY